MRIRQLTMAAVLAVGLTCGAIPASAQDEAYLSDSKYAGTTTFQSGTQFDDCLELVGDGTMQVLGGTFTGTWSELPPIAGLALQLPFVTFWRGQLTDTTTTQFTGCVFFGIMFSRIIQLTPSIPDPGRFIGIRSTTCPL